MLYRQGEIPLDKLGRGMWGVYGRERLFSTFGGNPQLLDSDWQCKKCGRKWYRNDIIKNYQAHCPNCGTWVGLKGLKFTLKQKGLEAF